MMFILSPRAYMLYLFSTSTQFMQLIYMEMHSSSNQVLLVKRKLYCTSTGDRCLFPVAVCITNMRYDGLLLQARRADGNSPSPVGRFSTNLPRGTKVLKCREYADSVTHSNDKHKPYLTCYGWVGPATESGHVHFM